MAEADPTIEAAAPGSEPIGSEAAAILLMLLGEEEAAQLIGRLDPQEVQTLGGAMFSALNNCVIANNSAFRGAGVAYGTLNNCLVISNATKGSFQYGNYTQTWGGGLRMAWR